MDGGKNQKWMTILRDYIVDNRFHHTFWCINPNSGDTGGLLGNDWSTWDEAKYGLFKKSLWQNSSGKFIGLDHRVPLGKNGISLGEHYGMDVNPISPTPTTKPTPTPTPTPTPDKDFVYGDLNGDGLVNTADYMLLSRLILEVPITFDINLEAGDVNLDGLVDTRDAILLGRYILEMIDTLPVE